MTILLKSSSLDVYGGSRRQDVQVRAVGSMSLAGTTADVVDARSTVIFGWRAASPPSGRTGHPVTNCKNLDRCVGDRTLRAPPLRPCGGQHGGPSGCCCGFRSAEPVALSRSIVPVSDLEPCPSPQEWLGLARISVSQIYWSLLVVYSKFGRMQLRTPSMSQNSGEKAESRSPQSCCSSSSMVNVARVRCEGERGDPCSERGGTVRRQSQGTGTGGGASPSGTHACAARQGILYLPMRPERIFKAAAEGIDDRLEPRLPMTQHPSQVLGSGFH